MSNKTKQLTAFIPAAGLGERLYPITKAVPKEMFPVGNKPVIHHLIDRLRDAEIADIVIGVNPQKKIIQQYLGNGSQFGVRIQYVVVPPHGINTTLWNGMQLFRNKPFLYCVSDVFLENNTVLKQLVALYHVRKKSILILQKVSKKHISRFAAPFVQKEKNNLWRITGFIEKPKPEHAPSLFASTGIMLVTPSFFPYLEKPAHKKEIQPSHYLNLFAKNEELLGFETADRMYDCSNPQEYAEAINIAAKKIMSAKKHKTSVTFVLLRPSGEMLIQLRDDGNGSTIQYPNRWCLPGGGIEQGESSREALVREINEEYNIHINEQHCKLLTVYNHDDELDEVYICHVDANASPRLREGKAMKWMKINELKKIKLAWHQEDIVPILEKYISLHS